MTEPVIAYAIRICNKFHSDVIMWFYYSVSLHVPTRYELGLAPPIVLFPHAVPPCDGSLQRATVMQHSICS